MHKAVLDTLRQRYSWFKGPVFIDEAGPTSRTTACRDQASAASWLVKTIHLLNENGPDYPPPAMLAYWAISDLYEEFQNKLNTLCFQEGNYGMLVRGSAEYPNSWDIPKPVFQAYRMLHQLGDFEVHSTGGTTANGVNLVATCDSGNNVLQILLYNHHVSETQSSSLTDDITLTVDNIPWTSGKARIAHLLVDTTHSNAYTAWVNLGKPALPTNAQWDKIRDASRLEQYDTVSVVTLAGNSFTTTFKAHYFSVHLITLSNPDPPASHQRAPKRNTVAPKVLQPTMRNGRLFLNTPSRKGYTVDLYSTDGKRLIRVAGPGCDETAQPVPLLCGGAYVMQYRSTGCSFTKTIFVQQ